MSRRFLWFMFCSLITLTVHGQPGVDNCLPSQQAYANLSLGNAEDVPVEFASGKSILNKPIAQWPNLVINY